MIVTSSAFCVFGSFFKVDNMSLKSDLDIKNTDKDKLTTKINESEKLIQHATKKLTSGRTSIVIAHRLSTIKKADKIIVLENGKIVEEGNHAELSKAQGGLYSKLLKLQEMGDVD